jgi:hypothetical protein
MSTRPFVEASNSRQAYSTRLNEAGGHNQDAKRGQIRASLFDKS